jgi:hypothetical protein
LMPHSECLNIVFPVILSSSCCLHWY